MAQARVYNRRSMKLGADGKSALLPTADKVEYGELAINYLKGYETLSTKNSNNEIVALKFGEYATVTSLSENVSSLESKISAKASTTELNSAVSGLESKISAKASTSDLNSAVSSLETKISAKASATDLSSAVSSLETKISAKASTSDMNAAVTRLESEISAKANSSDVSSTASRLESEISEKASTSSLNSAVSSLESKISEKANASDVYTKNEVNTSISNAQSSMTSSLGSYLKKTDAASTYQPIGDYQKALTATSPLSISNNNISINLGGYLTESSASVTNALSEYTYNNGVSSVSSVANIPVSYKLAMCTVSSSGSFSLASTLGAGKELHAIVVNSSSSSVTITLPNSGKYVSMGGQTSLVVSGKGYAEINVVSNGSTMYIRSIA